MRGGGAQPNTLLITRTSGARGQESGVAFVDSSRTTVLRASTVWYRPYPTGLPWQVAQWAFWRHGEEHSWHRRYRWPPVQGGDGVENPRAQGGGPWRWRRPYQIATGRIWPSRGLIGSRVSAETIAITLSRWSPRASRLTSLVSAERPVTPALGKGGRTTYRRGPGARR